MSSVFSTYLGNKILNWAVRGTAIGTVATTYVSLHTDDPSLTGANECTGGTYTRQATGTSPFNSAATTKTITNAGAAITFTLMPACTVKYVGLWDDPTAGNFLWGGSLSLNKTVNAGDTFEFAVSQLTFADT